MMGHGRTAFVSVSENLSSQIIQLIWSFRVKSTQIFDFAIIFFSECMALTGMFNAVVLTDVNKISSFNMIYSSDISL